MPSTRVHAGTAPVNILTPGKKRIALQRKKSDTQELKEALKKRHQDSFLRKEAIKSSLGKWESDSISKSSGHSVSGHSVSPHRRKNDRIDELSHINEDSSSSSDVKKKRSSRRRSLDTSSSPAAPALSRRAKMERSRSQSPHGLRALNAERGASPHGLRRRKSRRASNEGSTAGNLDRLLNNVDASKFRREARSVASAPTGAYNDDSDVSPKPPERRASRIKGNRTSRRPPRRTKSSEFVPVLKGDGEQEVEKPKKPKRRTKSFDADTLSRVSEHKRDKSARKSTKKKSQKKTKEEPEPSKVGEEREVIRVKREDRHTASSKQRIRSHSAGPLQRNEEVRDDSSERARLQRANSTSGAMLNRDMTRRSKSNSLADLVQYAESEIHSTSYFASNHVLVNRERMKRGVRPLTRNIAMDKLARESAEAMAQSAGCSQLRTTYVGNILRGESIRAVHRATMMAKDGRERANLLNPYFQDFGVGTAKGDDGMLYVCQLFSERLELNCTDVANDSD